MGKGIRCRGCHLCRSYQGNEFPSDLETSTLGEASSVGAVCPDRSSFLWEWGREFVAADAICAEATRGTNSLPIWRRVRSVKPLLSVPSVPTDPRFCGNGEGNSLPRMPSVPKLPGERIPFRSGDEYAR